MPFTGKNIAVFALLALMTAKMMGMPIVWLSYNLNKEYIAAKLCENKSRPRLNCNGQCIMMKKLAKANESNESKETKTEVKSIGVDFIQEPRPFIAENISTGYCLMYPPSFVYFPAPLVKNIFHPPGIAC